MTRKWIPNTLTAGLTALALALSLTPVRATKTTYRDVDDDSWYASYVAFCQQRGLMDGMAGASFEPGGLMTRATLTEALYRLEGGPALLRCGCGPPQPERHPLGQAKRRGQRLSQRPLWTRRSHYPGTDCRPALEQPGQAAA